MRLRIADIFRSAGEQYLASHRVSAVAVKAMHAVIVCRTAVLGGHAAVCKAGHVSVWYNACRHRCCPRCSFYRVQRWLERTSRVLLGRAHHHVIFTVPHDLNELWLLNRKVMGELLFAAARDALFTLCADPKYLGALPGLIMALHTWGQQLSFHPHVHCLVTAGGMAADGLWRDSRRKYFLPLEPLKRLFRGKLLDGVRRSAQRGALRLPAGWSLSELEGLTWRLHHRHWNIEVRERYGDPTAVLNYLGRYLHGGPFGEGRLVSFDGERVSFRYKDHRAQQEKVMTLPAMEFIRRYLQHVPPEGFHMVRGYGLYRRGRQNHDLQQRAHEQSPIADEVRAGLTAHPAPPPRAAGQTLCATCSIPVALVVKLRPLVARPRPSPAVTAA